MNKLTTMNLKATSEALIEKRAFTAIYKSGNAVRAILVKGY